MTYGSAYMARRRAEARRKGLCGQCCKRSAEPGKFRCTHCLAYQALSAQPYNRRLRVLAKDWCDECLSSGCHRPDCRSRAA